MICSTIPVDQGVLAPVPVALTELSHQVSDEQQDDIRVTIGLTDGNVALTKVIHCQKQ